MKRNSMEKKIYMDTSLMFNSFCDDFIIPERKKSIIYSRANSICRILNMEYWDLKSCSGGIFIGSFGRKTANAHVNEIELMFEIPISIKNKYIRKNNNPQFEFLMDVKNVISRGYTNVKINKEKQMIEVCFIDEMLFHILPVFRYFDKYIQADISEEGNWMVIDPISGINAINQADRVTGGNIQNLCKMAHAWRLHCNVQVNKKLLDTLVCNFLLQWKDKCCTYEHYDIMCKDFFRYLKSQQTSQKIWKTMKSDQMICNPEDFINKATLAYYNASSAIDFKKKKEYRLAIENWKAIFGNKFGHVTKNNRIEKKYEELISRYTQIGSIKSLEKKSCKSVCFQVLLAMVMFASMLLIGYTGDLYPEFVIFMVATILFFFALDI